MQNASAPHKSSKLLLSLLALTINVLMGVGSLAFIFFRAGISYMAQGLLVFGLFWVYAFWRRWMWVSSVGILLLVAYAGFGLWNGLSLGWLIAGILGGLLAWDLTEFIRRLLVAPADTDLPGMERRHVARLTLIAIAGLCLSSIFIIFQKEFTLEWILLLTLIGLLGLAQVLAWLRRAGS